MKLILISILLFFGSNLKAQIFNYPSLQGVNPDESFYRIGKYWVSYGKDSLIESKGKKLSSHMKRHGKWIFYYPSGKIKEEGRYKNGQRIGNWKYYNTEGDLVKEETLE